MGLDVTLQRLLNQPGNPTLDAAMIALSSQWLLLPLLLAAALYLALRTKPGWRAAVLLLAAFGTTDVLNAQVVKPAFHRVRPCNETPPRAQTIARIGCGRGQSFPSGHAANSAAAAAVFGWSVPMLAPIGVAAALLVGASRVYLGVHWPTDVLGGWLFGWAVAAALIWATRRLRR